MSYVATFSARILEESNWIGTALLPQVKAWSAFARMAAANQ